jgi:mono/diheme cytochrome c family protein
MFAAEALSTKERLNDEQIDRIDDAVRELLHQHEVAVDQKDVESVTQEVIAAELRDFGYHLMRG